MLEGSIKKYTRGKEDAFNYKGRVLPTNSSIYTDVDYTNLYVLDPEKKIVYVIDKSGNTVSNIPLSGMKNPKSIAADEKEKKIYIVSDNKVYSVDY
jgi:DNA-binding beta-propeller fold protein YncE